MITYDMQERGKSSKYEYLYQCIREDIRAGRLVASERLPSKRVLAHHLSVSISTVEQAYNLLVSEGYLSVRPGSGFFVCTGRSNDTHESQRLSEPASTQPPKRYAINFKENHCAMQLFPAETWSRLMRRTLTERTPELYQTVPYNGLLSLRRAIASYLYEFRGISTSPDNIVIGAGTEYLYSKLLQLFGPKSVIAIGEYGSRKLVDLSRSMSIAWCYVPIDDEGLRIDRLSQSPANIVHVSPANHFPTGIVMSESRRKQLLEWLHGIARRYVIEDDYDSELRYSGRALPPLVTQDDTGGVVYLNTFSKTLIPSIRISYMVLPTALMDLYRAQLSFYSCSVSSFEQYTLALFIEGGYFERHINRLHRYFIKQRSHVMSVLANSELSKIADIAPVSVGTHLLVRLHTRLSDKEIQEEAHVRDVNLSMLSDYSLEPDAFNTHCVVMNFASIEPSQVKSVVHVLEEIFSKDIKTKEAADERKAHQLPM
jgi:GntR family transcriptional regulator/MocR family aminotransferase